MNSIPLIIQVNSECSIYCYTAQAVSFDIQKRFYHFAKLTENQTAISEYVLGFNNITFFFDPFTVNYVQLTATLNALWSEVKDIEFTGKHIEIPVSYGGEAGIDLVDLANYHHLSVKEVIKLHTQPIYPVYFIGFQAGFPYLGDLLPQLHTPRHSVPRQAIPKGSVGIGGSQTGIYPFDSPGGWQIIGRTEIALFTPEKFPPTLLSAGDTVKFVEN